MKWCVACRGLWLNLLNMHGLVEENISGLSSLGGRQDHMRIIILLQNWAVALNANVWTSSQHDSLVSRTNIPQFLIGIYRTQSCALIKYSIPIPPRRFLPSFFSQWLLQLDRLSFHNSRTRMIETVQLCSCMQYRLAWTADVVHTKTTTYCYSVFIHWIELCIDVIHIYKKTATTRSIHKRLWMHRMSWQRTHVS